MNTKIIYDQSENEYICFLENCRFAGYGSTEEEAIINFLKKCEGKVGFNQNTIATLLLKLEMRI